jgi:hypothetical protein
MVITPNEDEEWTERTTKQDMEKAIMEHHVKKYSLTQNTPPMLMPIQRELGFDSLTPAGQSILDGTHTRPQAQTETADCFKNSSNGKQQKRYPLE